MKSQVLMGTACRTSEYLRILHNLRAGSSQVEKGSPQTKCERTKLPKSQSQLGCPTKQYESHLSPNKKQCRSKARKRKTKSLTTFARPSSATDLDEDSALDDSLENLSNQKPIAESYSISVGQEGVKSIFHVSCFKNKTGLKKKVSIDLFLPEEDNKSSFEQKSTKTEKCSKSDTSEKIQTSSELTDSAINLVTNRKGNKQAESLSKTVTKSSISNSTVRRKATRVRSKLSQNLVSSTSTKVVSTPLTSDKDLIQMYMKRLERNYRHIGTCFELGFKAEKILNAVHDGANIYFLVKYRDYDEPELVPSHIARSHIPLMVFQFYDQRFCWLQRQTNVRGKEIRC